MTWDLAIAIHHSPYGGAFAGNGEIIGWKSCAESADANVNRHLSSPNWIARFMANDVRCGFPRTSHTAEVAGDMRTDIVYIS